MRDERPQRNWSIKQNNAAPLVTLLCQIKVTCSVVMWDFSQGCFIRWPCFSFSEHLLLKRSSPKRIGRSLLKNGQYIFAIAGDSACHTVPKGTPHAGGRAFPIPFGTVYATNITSDKETGIGSWSDKEILNAMTTGIRPNGEWILPIMPHEAYSGIAEQDLKALIAYLRTIKPLRKETPRLKTWVPFYRSLLVPLWLKLFGRYSVPPAKAPESGVERGRYLVDHISLCGDCHTLRNRIGVPQRRLYLAGSRIRAARRRQPQYHPRQ